MLIYNNLMRKRLLFLCFFAYGIIHAQTGISVSPPRVYYEADPGQNSAQKISVSNVSTTHTLDLAISLGDWEYDLKGENIMYPADSLLTSCASWVTIKRDQNYFSLKPGETKEIEVSITIPQILSKEIPVHTALLYVTQMNPFDDVTKDGANIKVSVRSGIKLFHRTKEAKIKKIEIQNMLFDTQTKHIKIDFESQGNVWTDGIIYPEVLNTETGKKTTMEHLVFYTMPGNKRETSIVLPEGLENGKYVATIVIDYGNDTNIEMAELTFTYEK